MLIVQICDDDVFGTINEHLWKDFANMVKKEFDMSMTGEPTFFLRLQYRKQMKKSSSINPTMQKDIIKRLRIDHATPCGSPMSL